MRKKFMAILRLACVLSILLLPAMPAEAQSPTPVGVWEDASERIQVKVAPCGGDRLCGTLVWFRWPDDAEGLPVVDLKNADPALRSRPLMGLTILRGLRRTGNNMWANGEIYDPNEGEDHHARMWILEDGTLRVRIYDVFPIFGETQIWTRMR
jgi:uncharacterized protein (DUF2147 family)